MLSFLNIQSAHKHGNIETWLFHETYFTETIQCKNNLSA